MDAMLLDKITDAELASLECPTYESQENAWQIVLDSLSHDNIDTLVKLSTHNVYSLAHFELYTQTCGVINKIFILNVNVVNGDIHLDKGDFLNFSKEDCTFLSVF